MRITVSSTTPALTQRQAAAFRLLIEPPERGGMLLVPSTVGDVLDSEPKNCATRRLFYSETKSTFWVRNRNCEKRACSWCVVDNLAKTVGRAWAYFGKRSAEIIETSARSRAQRKFRMTGDDATPGVLNLPLGDGERVLFIPDGPVAGEALDKALVWYTREVPLEFRPPSASSAERLRSVWGIPDQMSLDEFIAIAALFGVTVTRLRNGRLHAEGVTREVVEPLMETVWGRRNLPERTDKGGGMASERTDNNGGTSSEPVPISSGGVARAYLEREVVTPVLSPEFLRYLTGGE